MKKVAFLFLISILFLHCKDEPVILFEMPYRTDFEIPAGLNPFDVHYFNTTDIPTKVDALFDAHNVDQADALAIQPHSARLSSVFNDGNFEFIRHISVRIYLDDPNDYREIFYRDEVPLNTGSDIDLIPTLTDIQEYIKREDFNVVVRFELRNASSAYIDTRLDFSLEVK